jgi:hypothetical protein
MSKEEARMSKEGTYEPDASGLPRTRHLSTVPGDKIGSAR